MEEESYEQTLKMDSPVCKKRKRCRKSKNKSPSSLGEDVCFCCYDGGSLFICNQTNCPKAYHAKCVGRDASFIETSKKWKCSCHICSKCQKTAHYMCYTCPSSWCRGCTKEAEFLHVKGNKGLCKGCKEKVMLIEKNEQGNKEMLHENLDDNDVNLGFYKDYWFGLKRKLLFTEEELHQATNPSKGSIVLAKRKLADRLDDQVSNSVSSSENLKVSSAKRRRVRKCSNSSTQEGSCIEARIDDDMMSGFVDTKWACQALLDFVAYVKNGDTSVLSYFDVKALLLEYIAKRNLRDPHQKSHILCHSRLENLFGEASIWHFDMLRHLSTELMKKDSQSDYIQEKLFNTKSSQMEVRGDAEPPEKVVENKISKMCRSGEHVSPEANCDNCAAYVIPLQMKVNNEASVNVSGVKRQKIHNTSEHSPRASQMEVRGKMEPPKKVDEFEIGKMCKRGEHISPEANCDNCAAHVIPLQPEGNNGTSVDVIGVERREIHNSSEHSLLDSQMKARGNTEPPKKVVQDKIGGMCRSGEHISPKANYAAHAVHLKMKVNNEILVNGSGVERQKIGRTSEPSLQSSQTEANGSTEPSNKVVEEKISKMHRSGEHMLPAANYDKDAANVVPLDMKVNNETLVNGTRAERDKVCKTSEHSSQSNLHRAAIDIKLKVGGTDKPLKKAVVYKRCKLREGGECRSVQSKLDNYAAIDVHNINLIFLRHKLVEDLLDDMDTFHEKIVGSFVRIRINSNEKQELHRLVQVIGTVKAPQPYECGERTTDIMLVILNTTETEIIQILSVSKEEFSEDECKCLRESIESGLVSQMTVGEVQRKARALQEVRVNDWLEKDKLQLSDRRDWASEKRGKKEQRECIQALQLLSKPEERLRRIQEIPEINADPNKNQEMADSDDKRQEDFIEEEDIGVSSDKEGSIRSVSSNGEKDLKETDEAALDTGICSVRGSESSTESLSVFLVNKIDKVWHYQDPSGTIQGPFSMLQLCKWSTTSSFPANMRIWRTERQEDSILLIDALNLKFSNSPKVRANGQEASEAKASSPVLQTNDGDFIPDSEGVVSISPPPVVVDEGENPVSEELKKDGQDGVPISQTQDVVSISPPLAVVDEGENPEISPSLDESRKSDEPKEDDQGWDHWIQKSEKEKETPATSAVSPPPAVVDMGENPANYAAHAVHLKMKVNNEISVNGGGVERQKIGRTSEPSLQSSKTEANGSTEPSNKVVADKISKMHRSGEHMSPAANYDNDAAHVVPLEMKVNNETSAKGTGAERDKVCKTSEHSSQSNLHRASIDIKLKVGGADKPLKKAVVYKICKLRERGERRSVQSKLDNYAAIDVHNINLIFLRHKLVEDLLDDMDTFHEKVVGSFIRIRINSNEKQELHRLVQVIGTVKAPQPYESGERTTDIMLVILNTTETEIIQILIVSKEEFSEDECKCLRESIESGLVSHMTVGEVQRKARALQEVRVNDWLEKEKLQLSDRRDWASEKGRRKEQRECIQALQLLSKPEERLRRIQEIPEIHADPNKNQEMADSDDKRQEDAMEEEEDIGMSSDKEGSIRSVRGSESSTESFSVSLVNKIDKVWHYEDPSGTIQGPFSMLQLCKWSTTSSFPANMRIWRTERQQDSIFLIDALNLKFSSSSKVTENGHGASEAKGSSPVLQIIDGVLIPDSEDGVSVSPPPAVVDEGENPVSEELKKDGQDGVLSSQTQDVISISPPLAVVDEGENPEISPSLDEPKEEKETPATSAVSPPPTVVDMGENPATSSSELARRKSDEVQEDDQGWDRWIQRPQKEKETPATSVVFPGENPVTSSSEYASRKNDEVEQEDQGWDHLIQKPETDKAAEVQLREWAKKNGEGCTSEQQRNRWGNDYGERSNGNQWNRQSFGGRQGRTKWRLCRYYEKGYCRLGDDCGFLHDDGLGEKMNQHKY